MIDVKLIVASFPALLKGALVSLEIASSSCSLGLILGMVLAALYQSGLKWIKVLIACYVTLFRGTPMLVQILFIYYVFPQIGIDLAAKNAVILAISLNSAAYISQIIRSGINAVPKGQWEGASVLGFSKWETIRHIIMPQALRNSLPSLGNEFITLIKDSSLASIIGVVELSKEASLIRSRTYDPFTVLIVVGLIYLLMTATVSLLLKLYEQKAKQYV